MSELSGLVETRLHLGSGKLSFPPPTPLTSPLPQPKRRRLQEATAWEEDSKPKRMSLLSLNKKLREEVSKGQERLRTMYGSNKRKKRTRPLDSMAITAAFYRARVELDHPSSTKPVTTA